MCFKYHLKSGTFILTSSREKIEILNPVLLSITLTQTLEKPACLKLIKHHYSCSTRTTSHSSENYLRPCPLLGNTGRLADMVDKSGAKSTDMQYPEDVHVLCDKCKTTADNWEITVNKLWKESHGSD